jgi:Flp pilus assembly protein TadD
VKIGAFLVCVLALASSLEAQTRSRRPRGRTNTSASSNASVRAELAGVLLQSGKYSDAAREYRTLVSTDSRNTEYRLGLIRALAWGERYREAEEQLSLLPSSRRDDSDVEQLERLVRGNLEPPSFEAQRWVAERPHYAPYRVALAHAWVREHHPGWAIAQYDTLLATNPTPALVRDLADAYAAANNRAGGITRLREFVARAPADSGYRLALADVLASDRQYAAAIAETDTVLSYGRTPGALMTRARIDIASDDLVSAERDLNDALALKPTPEAYLLLGDTYRWRGEFGKARTVYQYARVMKKDRTVTAAFAQLARDERSVLTFEPASAADEGWQTSVTADGDNGGIHYSTVDFERGFQVGSGFVGGASMQILQLSEMSAVAHGTSAGYATNVGLSREGIAGAFYGRVGATAGLIFHPIASTVPAASLALTGRYYAWSASFDMSSGPAYPSLRTLASVIPSGEGSRPLTELNRAFSLAGPVGPVDIAVGLRRADISDSNRRNELEAYGRLPVTPVMSLVYWGNSIAFALPTANYWSPQHYASNALGLELAARQLRGLSLVARLLPGVASTDDSPFTHTGNTNPGGRASPNAQRLRFQISTGGELDYRRPGWETGLGFDWGRIANYSRTSLSFHLSLNR